MEQIRRLYLIERRARDEGLSPPQRSDLRNEKAPEILKLLHQRLEALRADSSLLPQSPLGKAVNYAWKEWEVLLPYLDNGVLEIDNNLCENSIRPACLEKRTGYSLAILTRLGGAP